MNLLEQVAPSFENEQRGAIIAKFFEMTRDSKSFEKRLLKIAESQ